MSPKLYRALMARWIGFEHWSLRCASNHTQLEHRPCRRADFESSEEPPITVTDAFSPQSFSTHNH